MTSVSLHFRLVVAILTPASLAAQAEPWLAEVPTAKQVVTALRASTSRINAVRAAAALYSFTNLIQSLAGTQALSAAANARLAELMPERDRIANIEYSKDRETYKFERCKAAVDQSPAFHRELLDRFFSARWITAYGSRLDPRRWKAPLALPPGTKLTDSPHPDCGPSAEQALALLRTRALAGDTVARLALGRSYYDRGGVRDDFTVPADLDLDEAEKWINLAVLADPTNEDYRAGRWAVRFQRFEVYGNHYGLRGDTAHRKADAGDAESQYGMGMLKSGSRGNGYDSVAAAAWWEKAAGRGIMSAKFKLAVAHKTGWGVPKDPARSATLFRELALAGGYPEAAFELGLAYVDGIGVTKDVTEAIKWYRYATSDFHAGAMTNLGLLHHLGTGVARDYAEALRWYRQGAALGDQMGARNIAVMYQAGQGVPKDEVRATAWYRRAAELGDTYSQYAVGVRLSSGIGAEVSAVEGYRWVRIAAVRAASDTTYQKWAKYLEAKLTSQQVTEARTAADDWISAFNRAWDN